MSDLVGQGRVSAGGRQNRRGNFGVRLYRALLLCYPAEFRQEFGAEMERLAAERMGSESRPRLWLSLIADLAVSAPREHLAILGRDARHSLRMLRRAPGFTATALIALALGVGASVTIFSVIDAVLLRGLPFGAPGRLVYLWSPLPRYESVPRELGPSFADVLAFGRMSGSFAGITAVKQRMVTIDAGSGPMQAPVAAVLGNFFETLRSGALIGRTIVPADDDPGKERVAVISYDFWRARYRLDAGVLGRKIAFPAGSYRVVGVMPPEFGYPHDGDFPFAAAGVKQTELWIPEALTAKQEANRLLACDAAIGRLRDGVTLPRAQAEMSAIAKQLDPLNAPEMRGTESLLVPFLDTATGPVRPLMRLLAGAVLLVLLIACGNVANLLLARAAGRGHELGVRTALGAPRARLVRQLMTESLLLSLAGGGLGAGLSVAALRVLQRLNPGDIPRFGDASIDGGVLLFALAISLATGAGFGMLPALTASRVQVSDLLRQGGRGAITGPAWARSGLIAANVALAVVLLATAGLFLRSYLQVQGEDKGFAPSTLTMRLAVSQRQRTAQQASEFGRSVMERIAAIPGVVAVGGTNAIPLAHRESVATFRVEGYPNRDGQTVDIRSATGRLFEAMQIRLLAGRDLEARDVPASGMAAAVAINEAFARQYFRGRRAIGGHVQTGDPGANWSTVVGMVADVRHASLEKPPRPTLYVPSWNVDSIAIRSAVPPESIVRAVRSAIHEIDAGSALTDIETMGQRTGEAAARRTFQTALLTAFAGIALFLALVGLYGLLAFTVRQRAAEIGVRMALGADRGAVVGMVVRHGLRVTAAGLGIGLTAAAAVARGIAPLLYGVRAPDPFTFGMVPILILAAAALACLLPAWKAARIDPVASLRE